METPYGGLWYAAGNPDGFRFGTVNRPSPPRAIYMQVTSQHQTVIYLVNFPAATQQISMNLPITNSVVVVNIRYNDEVILYIAYGYCCFVVFLFFFRFVLCFAEAC